MPASQPSRGLLLAAFAAIYVIWGSTYLGILLAIQTIPPFLMAASRFLLAGGLLLAYSFWRGERWPDRRSVTGIAFSGLLMLFIGNGAVTWVEQYLPTGLAAIIVATVPLWMVLLDRRQWTYHFSNRKIMVGLGVGFVGVILLFAGKGSADIFSDRNKLVSVFVLIAGTVSWTVGTLFTKYRKLEGSTFMKSALQMLAAGLAFVPLSIARGEHRGFSLHQVSAASLGAVLYLIVFGSILAYLAYIWLLSVRPASLVGTYAYVNPAVAVFLGWLVADEVISGQQLLGLVVIIGGLVVVNFAKATEAKP